MAAKKPKKKQSIRNSEYYNTQKRFDQLYQDSLHGKRFTQLMDIITSEENIMLAYRSIKKNKGSKTKGTNNSTIVQMGEKTPDELISYVRKRLKNFHPHAVRRVEIPKPDGRLRPLGIPTIEDRIIQQCIKQVLEPICEARFYKHSYGFRPNRSAHHAIARAMFLTNQSDFHFVVDVDIKGFFDNVDHGKLLKQLWTLVLPNMLSGAALQVSFLVDRSLAICLGPQAVPALTNVDRLVDLPIGIFAIALSSVLMVNMSHSAARGDQTEIAESLIFSLRHVYFICIPMAALMVGFWEPMIRLLCLGGNYTESDLEATRFVAIFYGAGIPAFCAIKMLLPVFYARRKMLIPLYSSLTAIVVNLVLNLILMWHLRQGGIALATVLSSMLNNFILYRCLRREGFDLRPGVLGRTFLRSLVLAAATAGVLHLLYPCWRTALTFRGVGELPAFLLLLLLFGGLYLGGSLLCRAPEVRELFSLLRRRRAA